MVRVSLVTYENLGKEILNLVEEITGEREYINLLPADKDSFKDDVETELKNAPKDGLLFITDICGTPHTNYLVNLKSDLAPFEVITGLSISMLISAIKYAVKAETDLSNMANNIIDESLKSVMKRAEIFGSFLNN